ncbi:hypothetical protein FACS1894139_05920 [Planctomycetales bacterium]|nr:hypothetical protein FACS1894107_05260 [Planctomycetales bacterium]GHS97591.1 hypothetical protein FACS1894108_04230 [Planctomycetales bacterium]GHT04188.1 hypothetical protein FACS1894139_05920 [Planctomycetales bacterium]
MVKNHARHKTIFVPLDLFDNRRNKNGRSGASFRQNHIFRIRRVTCCPDNAFEVSFYRNINSSRALHVKKLTVIEQV